MRYWIILLILLVSERSTFAERVIEIPPMFINSDFGQAGDTARGHVGTFFEVILTSIVPPGGPSQNVTVTYVASGSELVNCHARDYTCWSTACTVSRTFQAPTDLSKSIVLTPGETQRLSLCTQCSTNGINIAWMTTPNTFNSSVCTGAYADGTNKNDWALGWGPKLRITVNEDAGAIVGSIINRDQNNQNLRPKTLSDRVHYQILGGRAF